MARKPDTRTQDEHYMPKPPPVEPHKIVLATELMVAPALPSAATVTRSVTRRGPERPNIEGHREHARARAIEVFDEMFDHLVQFARDKNSSPQARMAALKYILELSLERDEGAVETETFTSHLDALQGLAMRPAAKQLPK